MATRSFSSFSNFVQGNSSHLNRHNKFPHFFNLQNQKQSDNFSRKSCTESLPSSPINVKYLEREFSGHGAAFEAIGDDCVVKMGLEEGSTANMLLPSGLITSYKPTMWHGGRAEVLHTLVSEDQNGEAVVQGGVSMDLKCASDGGFAWSPTTWALQDVRGSSDKFIQVTVVFKTEQIRVCRGKFVFGSKKIIILLFMYNFFYCFQKLFMIKKYRSINLGIFNTQYSLPNDWRMRIQRGNHKIFVIYVELCSSCFF